MTPRDIKLTEKLDSIWKSNDYTQWDIVAELSKDLEDRELRKVWNGRAYTMYLREEGSSGLV